jgi:alcohol dehydrogenase YqhD (iron-dependent ADH family)
VCTEWREKIQRTARGADPACNVEKKGKSRKAFGPQHKVLKWPVTMEIPQAKTINYGAVELQAMMTHVSAQYIGKAVHLCISEQSLLFFNTIY